VARKRPQLLESGEAKVAEERRFVRVGGGVVVEPGLDVLETFGAETADGGAGKLEETNDVLPSLNELDVRWKVVLLRLSRTLPFERRTFVEGSRTASRSPRFGRTDARFYFNSTGSTTSRSLDFHVVLVAVNVATWAVVLLDRFHVIVKENANFFGAYFILGADGVVFVNLVDLANNNEMQAHNFRDTELRLSSNKHTLQCYIHSESTTRRVLGHGFEDEEFLTNLRQM
jgi:hypothetical protein